ncbi:MAG TPA: hypothetical protein DCR11_02765, partial [Deltaproteobacteria bacterium]|nr:hypothetical protein [Deltaproteobacteria bacterium]
GWCIREAEPDRITFALMQGSGACSNGSSASQLAPGGSLVFNITMLSLAASADVAGDTLTSVTVDTQGGFSRSGALPTWTRRSFEPTLVATPESLGVGGTITLTMQVTNRSTATQSNITSTPTPPTPSSAIATLSEGPYYGSTALDGNHSASATVITVASTTGFTSPGAIRIDSEDICYTGMTATTFTGVTRGCNLTTAAAHTTGAVVYAKTQYSLTAGQTGVIIWLYSVTSTGTVYFTTRATNSGSTANSVLLNSNTVLIGNFTASITVTPESVITGQSVTVEMEVKNNGASALINLAPSALTQCAGGATETLLSGPSPSSISSLGSGSTGVFSWTYTITGSIGQAYCLSGYGTASGGATTNTATSNSGAISQYSATVAPSVIASGTANKTLTWSVYNGGACTLKKIEISFPGGGGNWTCSSVGPPAGWTSSCNADKVSFKSSSSANDIPSGGTKSFSITYSTTETVISDKVVAFPVIPSPRSGCNGSEAEIGTYVTVTAYGLSLAHSPIGPVYADGSATYTMTATLVSGATPVAGKTVTFSTTSGTLSPATAVTDANGEATVALIAPNSTTDTTATVTASYLNSSGTDIVSFTGWNKANIQYWGSLSPASASCGSTVSFTMVLKNISATTSMTPNTASYFAFNDSSAGGSNVFQAYLNSAVTLSAGATQTLVFGSPTSSGGGGGVAIPSSFLTGTYSPTLNSAPPPASGLFLTDGGTNDQYRTVTDTVTISGDCGAVNVYIIEWHEFR